MFTYDMAVAPATGTLLEWISAIRAVQKAISALEDVGASLIPLLYESEWQADGVRRLHELIVQLKAGTAAEAGDLGIRLWEIQSRPTP
ncbi:hypothetical protein ACW5CM_00910 [Microbacterium sp. A588]